MPYLLGTDPIRRTIPYLKQGKLIFRKCVKVMSIHFNDQGAHHEGTRDFVRWNMPQVMYKNPDVQVAFYKNMFPTPFIRCWLDDGSDVLMDAFGKSNEEIINHLVKILGQPKSEQLEMEQTSEIKKDISNFGSGCERHCLCEIPGQIPCPALVALPKHMTCKYKFENNLMPKRGLWKP